MEQALRVVYSVDPRRCWLNCLLFLFVNCSVDTISRQSVPDCMLMCMNRTEAPCQNHWGVEVLGVAAICNNANVCFLYFSARTTEGTNETV